MAASRISATGSSRKYLPHGNHAWITLPDRLRQKCRLSLEPAWRPQLREARYRYQNAWTLPGQALPLDPRHPEARVSRLLRKSLKGVGCRAQLVGGCETGAEVSLAKSEAGLAVKLTCFSPFCQARCQDPEKVACPRLLIFIVHARLVQDARHKGKTVTGALWVSAGQCVEEFQNCFGIIG